MHVEEKTLVEIRVGCAALDAGLANLPQQRDLAYRVEVIQCLLRQDRPIECRAGKTRGLQQQ